MAPEAEISDTRRRPDTLAAWVQAFRVFSLTASITPVLLGTVMAWRDGFFSLSRLALTLLGAVAIHIGTNLTNDYYDHVNGIDSTESMGSRVFSLRVRSGGAESWRSRSVLSQD